MRLTEAIPNWLGLQVVQCVHGQLLGQAFFERLLVQSVHNVTTNDLVVTFQCMYICMHNNCTMLVGTFVIPNRLRFYCLHTCIHTIGIQSPTSNQKGECSRWFDAFSQHIGQMPRQVRLQVLQGYPISHAVISDPVSQLRLEQSWFDLVAVFAHLQQVNHVAQAGVACNPCSKIRMASSACKLREQYIIEEFADDGVEDEAVGSSGFENLCFLA